MDFLQRFIQFLHNQKNKPSIVTIKNYKADIQQFIIWFEKEFQKSFSPLSVTSQIIDIYKTDKITHISPKSLERHVSSLRKFFYFLKLEGIIVSHPLEKQITIKPQDKWHLKDFKNHLYVYNAATLTIKNYINDVRQFLEWTQQITGSLQSWDIKDQDVIKKISPALITEYKDRLLHEAKLSPNSINRKLSSVRRYIRWIQQEGLLDKKITPLQENVTLGSPTPTSYSSLAPIRLLQRIKNISNYIIEHLFIIPIARILTDIEDSVGRLRKKPTFSQGLVSAGYKKVSNIPKSFYAPLSLSKAALPFHKKMLFFVLYNRPKWYKKYHLYPLVHYFHFALFIFGITFLSTYLYRGFSLYTSREKAVLSTEILPRTLSFTGRLSDKLNQPITTSQQVTFSLYNHATQSGISLLWKEIDIVSPNKQGFFTMTVGDHTPLSQSLFLENSRIWLGTQVGDDTELTPRQELPTIQFARNAESLEGLLPISHPNASTKNVILALDSSGNLNMEGSSHLFQATGGEFILSGQQVTITTVPGSLGNVKISPVGPGKIDLQKGLVNTSSEGEVSGAVEVLDRFSVSATESAGTAFTVNNHSTGNLIAASSSGVPKFVVSNDGSVGIGTATPNNALDVKGSITPVDDGKYNIGSPLWSWKNVYAQNVLSTVPSGTQGWWQRNGQTLLPLNISDDLLIGGTSTNSSKLRFEGITGNIITKGSLTFNDIDGLIQTTNNRSLKIGSSSTGDIFLLPKNSLGQVGVNTLSPLATFDIRGSLSTIPAASISAHSSVAALVVDNSTGDLFTASSSGAPQFVIAKNGFVGIGTSLPDFRLQVIDSQPATVAAFIQNVNTSSTATGLAIKLGFTDLGTTTNYFTTFLNGKGNIQGKIQSNGNGGISYSTSGIDFAEYFKKEDVKEELWPAELVCLGKNGGVTKCTQNDPNILGIVSDRAGFIGGGDHERDPNFVLVGLSGQLPVKVSQENGTIKPGDFITSSHSPGLGKKATAAALVIGKVLEQPYNNTVLVAVQPFFYDPDVNRTSADNFAVEENNTSFGAVTATITQQNQTISFTLRNKETGEAIKRIGAFNQAIIAHLEAGFIRAKELAVDGSVIVSKTLKASTVTTNELASNTLKASTATIDSIKTTMLEADSLISNNIVSPIAFVDRLHTDVISPLASRDVIVQLTSDTNSKFAVENASGSAVASIDSLGNARFAGDLEARRASFSGSLITQSLETNTLESKEASIAGTLRADRIINIATLSGKLAYVENLTSTFATFQQGLLSLGPASFSEGSFLGTVVIGNPTGGLILGDNAINVVGTSLELQPLRQGDIHFLGGLVSIDTEGNLLVKGNAVFDKNVVVNGILSANIISPVPYSDLLVRLNDDQNSESGKFSVQSPTGKEVFSVNSKGDMQASGSATFGKLNLSLVTAAFAISDSETIASGSAGIATVSAQKSELTLRNSLVTKKSLIYITPTGDTNNEVLYLLRQAPGISFTVGINHQTSKDIPFNWLIVN